MRKADKRWDNNFCRNGHEYTPENTIWHSENGKKRRRCKTCKINSDIKYYREFNPIVKIDDTGKWTHCIRGHEFTEENTYWFTQNGQRKRNCRICRVAAQKESRLRRLYNLSVDGFNSMIAAQDSKCYICQTSDFGYNGICIDHNHSTGTVRKLLCNSCNAALGYAKDSPDLLRKMADYLESFKEHNE